VHFLFKKKDARSRYFVMWRPYACVTVEVLGKKKLKAVPGSIAFLKSDARLVALPEDVIVVDDKGNVIEPSRGFFITTETFDPYHAIIDARIE